MNKAETGINTPAELDLREVRSEQLSALADGQLLPRPVPVRLYRHDAPRHRLKAQAAEVALRVRRVGRALHRQTQRGGHLVDPRQPVLAGLLQFPGRVAPSLHEHVHHLREFALVGRHPRRAVAVVIIVRHDNQF